MPFNAGKRKRYNTFENVGSERDGLVLLPSAAVASKQPVPVLLVQREVTPCVAESSPPHATLAEHAARQCETDADSEGQPRVSGDEIADADEEALKGAGG